MSQPHTTPQRSSFPVSSAPPRRRSSDSGLPSERSRDSGNPRPEPYRPGPLRGGGAAGQFAHSRGGASSRSNGMGSRGGAFVGRSPAGGGRRDDAVEEDFNKLLMCLVGQTVEVQRTDGAVFQGIFHTREGDESREFGVVLKMARLVREIGKDGKVTSKSEAVKEASRRPPMKTVYVQRGDFVQIIAKDVPLSGDALSNGSLRGLDDVMTDMGISWRRSSLEGRELKPWKPEASDARPAEYRLEAHSGAWGSGGSSNSSGRWDQFATNRELFGVHTTFDENFYTTPLEKGNDALSRQREREAARIAREIEQSTSKNPHLAEERGQKAAPEIEALGEEERFSSVLRHDADAQANEDEHDQSIDDRNDETFGDVPSEPKDEPSISGKPTREGGSSPDDPSDLFKEHLQLRLHVPTTRKVSKTGSPYGSPVGRRSPLTSPLVAGESIQALNLDPSIPHVTEEVLKDFHEFKKSIREDSAQYVKETRDHQTNELRSFSETYGKGLKKDAEGSPRLDSPRLPRTPSQPEGGRPSAQETSPPQGSKPKVRTGSPGDVRKSDEARKQRAQSPASIAQKAAAAATAQAAPATEKTSKLASKPSSPVIKPSSPALPKPFKPTGEAPSKPSTPSSEALPKPSTPSKPSSPISRTASIVSDAPSATSSGAEQSTPAKSKLNPNAKEFKFNPGAKEFVPGGRPSSASSPYNRPVVSPQHPPQHIPPPQQPVFMPQGMPPQGVPLGQFVQPGQYNQFQMQQMQGGGYMQQPQFVPGGQPMMPGQPGMRPPQGQQQPMYQQQMGFPPQGPPHQPGQPGFMQYPGVQQFPQQQPGQQLVRMPNGQLMIMNPQYMPGQPLPLPGQPPIQGQPQQPPQQQSSPQQQKIRGGLPPQQGMPYGAPFIPGQPPPPHLQQGPLQHPHMHPVPPHIPVLPGGGGGHQIVQASPPMGPGKKGPQ